MEDLIALEQRLTRPSARLIEDIKNIDADIMLLGIGGKMGPSMGKLAAAAVKEAGINKRIIGVSRFSDVKAREELEKAGIETIVCDLLNDEELSSLSEVKIVIYLAGHKFGTVEQEGFKWAITV